MRSGKNFRIALVLLLIVLLAGVIYLTIRRPISADWTPIDIPSQSVFLDDFNSNAEGDWVTETVTPDPAKPAETVETVTRANWVCDAVTVPMQDDPNNTLTPNGCSKADESSLVVSGSSQHALVNQQLHNENRALSRVFENTLIKPGTVYKISADVKVVKGMVMPAIKLPSEAGGFNSGAPKVYVFNSLYNAWTTQRPKAFEHKEFYFQSQFQADAFTLSFASLNYKYGAEFYIDNVQLSEVRTPPAGYTSINSDGASNVYDWIKQKQLSANYTWNLDQVFDTEGFETAKQLNFSTLIVKTGGLDDKNKANLIKILDFTKANNMHLFLSYNTEIAAPPDSDIWAPTGAGKFNKASFSNGDAGPGECNSANPGKEQCSVADPLDTRVWDYQAGRVNELINFVAENQGKIDGFIFDSELYASDHGQYNNRGQGTAACCFSDALLTEYVTAKSPAGFNLDTIKGMALDGHQMRLRYMVDNGYEDNYEAFLYDKLSPIVNEKFRQVVQANSQDLMLGFMLYSNGNWFDEGLVRGLGTPEMPTLIFAERPAYYFPISAYEYFQRQSLVNRGINAFYFPGYATIKDFINQDKTVLTDYSMAQQVNQSKADFDGYWYFTTWARDNYPKSSERFHACIGTEIRQLTNLPPEEAIAKATTTCQTNSSAKLTAGNPWKPDAPAGQNYKYARAISIPYRNILPEILSSICEANGVTSDQCPNQPGTPNSYPDLPGDVNWNGKVDELDLSELIAGWNIAPVKSNLMGQPSINENVLSHTLAKWNVDYINQSCALPSPLVAGCFNPTSDQVPLTDDKVEE